MGTGRALQRHPIRRPASQAAFLTLMLGIASAVADMIMCLTSLHVLEGRAREGRKPSPGALSSRAILKISVSIKSLERNLQGRLWNLRVNRL